MNTLPEAPKPPCAIYLTALPELRAGALSQRQKQTLHEHLKECVVCREQAEGDATQVIEDAVLRHYDVPTTAAPFLTLDDIRSQAELPEADDLHEINANITPIHLYHKGTVMQTKENRHSDNEPTAVPSFVTPLPQKRSTSRWRSGVAVASVIGLIAVFALVVHTFLGAGHPTAKKTHPNLAATPSSAVNWKVNESFQVPGAVTLSSSVIVAPSDPKVIYVSDAGQTTLTFHRSTDGGQTWHTLTAPSGGTVGSYPNVVLQVDPLNAQVVYATVSYNIDAGSSCPAASPTALVQRNNQMAEMAAFSAGNYCTYYYVSANGGTSWSTLSLPMSNAIMELPIGLNSNPNGIGPTQLFTVQNGHIYAPLLSTTGYGNGFQAPGFQLMSSTDGIHWTMASAPLAAQNLAVVEYVATPNGATLFATTIPNGSQDVNALKKREFWRSDDSGSHWTHLGKFPEGQDSTSTTYLLSATSSGSQTLVYYGVMQQYAPSFAPTSILGSADNGKTWQPAPQGNFASNQQLQLWGYNSGQNYVPSNGTPGNGGPIIGSLADGSLLVMASIGGGSTPVTSFAVYSWKLGDTTWTQVSAPLAIPQGPASSNAYSTPGYGLFNQWFTPATNGMPATLWGLTASKNSFTLSSCTLG